MQYHYLVAGLPEYTFDSANSKINVREIREQIKEELTEQDRKAVELLYTYYDIQNIVNFVNGSSLPFNTLGNLDERMMAALLATGVDAEQADEFAAEYAAAVLPPFVVNIVERYKGNNSVEMIDQEPVAKEELETALYTEFYAECATDKSEYLHRWSDTDRMIRNVTAAYNARALQIDATNMIVDTTELRDSLLNSQSSDFGLKGEFEYMDPLLQVLETSDFVERERKMDRLRWDIAEELAEGDYFGIGRILMYLIHLNILYRWVALDPKHGQKSFRAMVNTLTDPERISTPNEK